MSKVLILGGYGNFGQRISMALAKADIAIVIAGRDRDKAGLLARDIKARYAQAEIEIAVFDVNRSLAAQLQKYKPAVVINTCGPFQLCDYSVALTCIEHKVHYIDLSDGREFVNGISTLDEQAKAAQVLVVSGASTVPGLSSAVLEKYSGEFSQIDSLVYGISPGQQAHRGLATTKAIMTYVGRALKPFAGHAKAYGWQDIYRQVYPVLGKRWMANCEVPDLDLLPQRYGIQSIRFSAGMELTFMHLGIYFLSWLVRLGIPLNLPRRAALLLKASNGFNRFGTADGGMHMIMSGKDKAGGDKKIEWFIIAKEGDGPQIPTIPAIILTKQLLNGQLSDVGAKPCVGLVSLDDYLAELKDFAIEQIVQIH